jgi:hypothetical protein
MKKLFFVSAITLAVLTSCGGEKKENGTEEAAAAKTDSVAANMNAAAKSDTTLFACKCGHGCTTKEECEKNCGPDCQSKN